jgi:hypothetical protein
MITPGVRHVKMTHRGSATKDKIILLASRPGICYDEIANDEMLQDVRALMFEHT